ncbi:MAG: hypothetical protein ABJX32_17860 [Tateyamaria sp.]|uniref:COG3904 family protein n=1 Tax=Tateyamaria sp. TaxID=1929288 RepID=UPI00329F0106
MRVFLPTVFTLLLCLFVDPAAAANIARGGSAYMGCTATLSGILYPEDSEAVSAYFEDSDDAFHVLCLDSPGGSLSEGIRIGDILQERGVPTAVGRNAECLSACAVLFLAGLEWFNDGTPPLPQRLLHAGGRLGFHAPSLTVSEGSFTQEQVSRAYDIAIATLAEIGARKADWKLSDSLLTTLLRTPPSEMYEVDTVFKAALWGISVVGTAYPANNSFLNAAEACTKDYAHRRETGRVARSGTPIGPESRSGYEPALVDDVYNGVSIRLGGFGDEGRFETCVVSFTSTGSSGLSTEKQAARAIDAWGGPNWFARVDWSGGDVTFMLPSMFFPSATPLAAIAAPMDGQYMSVETARFLRPDIDLTSSGRCTVWRGDQLADNERCNQSHLRTVSPKLVYTDEKVFTWPSGVETVIKSVNFEPTVNGRAAKVVWDWEQPATIAGQCWFNEFSGNTFCFEPS